MYKRTFVFIAVNKLCEGSRVSRPEIRARANPNLYYYSVTL